LHVELEITAPHVLTKPWKTTRIFFRQRARKFDIVEGVCQMGDYREAKDENGHHVFVPIEKTEGGNLVAPKSSSNRIDLMMNHFKPIGVLAVAATVAVGIASVSAHHSTTMFDHSITMTINGEVVELRWVNPHVSLSVNG